MFSTSKIISVTDEKCSVQPNDLELKIKNLIEKYKRICKLGDYQTAIQYLNHAYELAPKHPSVLGCCSALFAQKGDWNTAYRLLLVADEPKQEQAITPLQR